MTGENSDVGFTVTVPVPDAFSWQNISENVSARNLSAEEAKRLRTHYGHLLRMSSWQHTMDWDPLASKITLRVPNSLFQQQERDPDGTVIDGISCVLYKIVESVSIEYLHQHFKPFD